MALLFFGLFLLVSFMLTVMGIPLLYHLKRDRQWEQAGKTLEAWYRA